MTALEDTIASPLPYLTASSRKLFGLGAVSELIYVSGENCSNCNSEFKKGAKPVVRNSIFGLPPQNVVIVISLLCENCARFGTKIGAVRDCAEENQ